MPETGKTRKRRTPRVSPDEYARFIGQIELTCVFLVSAQVENHHGPESPSSASVHIEAQTRSHWVPKDGGFRAFYDYLLSFLSGDKQLAEIEVGLGLDFESKLEMTDELFELFAEVNLPVNTWPYLREFAASATGRMNWVPFTLPALKRGVDQAARPARGAARTAGRQPKQSRSKATVE
jgi:hypothetical protein